MMIAASWKEADILRLPKYYGKPCGVCAGTVRWRGSKKCIGCDRKRVHALDSYRQAQIRHQRRRTKAKRTTEKGKAANRIYRRKQQRRIRSTPEGRLAKNLRDRLQKAVKRSARGGSAVRDLGCSIQEFRLYIEGLFEPGWSWEGSSWGPIWHLDHIKPLSWFVLSDPEQIKIACHWSNLRPYPADLNCLEGGRKELKDHCGQDLGAVTDGRLMFSTLALG